MNFQDFNDKNVTSSLAFLENNTIVAKLAFIILIVFIFVVLLKFGTQIIAYFFTPDDDPILIKGIQEGTTFTRIPVDPRENKSIPILRSQDRNEGLVFTWSTWLYFKEPELETRGSAPGQSMSTQRQFKHIFNKGNDYCVENGIVQPNNAPGLYISNDYRELLVVMSTFENPTEIVTITNIPIQHWMNVIIRVNQYKLDVFINGTLTKTAILKGLPNQNYEPVYVALNGGFHGFISKLQYFAYSIGANQIQEIVAAGPMLNGIGGNVTNTNADYLSFKWFYPYQSSES
jgi:hypothetical protein